MKLRNSIKVAGLALLAATSAQAQDIKVGHLTYHTGEYGAWGDFFDGVADLSLSVINADPPLGRPFVAVHQDIGTIGEAQAVRKLVDSEGVEILLNPAHSYLSYREFILDKIAENGYPLMPSVHGGSIEAEYGGTSAEPLFRASPMDSAQGNAALLHAQAAGVTSIAIIATEVAGSQLQKEAALLSAEALGIEVVASVDIQPGEPNYRSVVQRIARDEPQGVIIFSAPADGGAIVKNAAEAGQSWYIIGTSEWQETEFVDTATTGAIDQHQEVVFAAFAPQEGPAFDWYKPMAEASPQAEAIGDVANSYALQYYDVLVATALAIEHAGSTNAEAWAASMFAVTGGEGQSVGTYAEGIKLLRAGEAINYDGVTGSMQYGPTGVVAGLYGIFEWVDGELSLVSTVDGDAVLALEGGSQS
ncbi:ABC transporter substrate-binding protein [Loktanella sp. Alg231-35]|uniref:ABC transporter substrate-binding protein n=1 Tax=Loktanella sp. Alg231-35 TaxID=1922220 RepID=UPI00131F0517|nr:ABC transporter substrate-binding protein [Loktanella sp. Alg231-35]